MKYNEYFIGVFNSWTAVSESDQYVSNSSRNLNVLLQAGKWVLVYCTQETSAYCVAETKDIAHNVTDIQSYVGIAIEKEQNPCAC